jgi:hypothetical protein
LHRLAEVLGCVRENWDLVRTHLDRLQARFDADAQEFAVEGAMLKQGGQRPELQRQAGLFMQQCVELLDTVLTDLETRTRNSAVHMPQSLVSDC